MNFIKNCLVLTASAASVVIGYKFGNVVWDRFLKNKIENKINY